MRVPKDHTDWLNISADIKSFMIVATIALRGPFRWRQIES